jgi:hypothetical protein
MKKTYIEPIAEIYFINVDMPLMAGSGFDNTLHTSETVTDGSQALGKDGDWDEDENQ